MIARMTIAAALLLAGASAGATHTYGESLVEAVHLNHPDVIAIRIAATARDGHPLTVARSWMSGKGVEQTLELQDSNGKPIGSVIVVTRCNGQQAADAVARDLGRRIYLSDNLAESDPFVEGVTRARFASMLVDEAIERDPSLVTIAFHVTSPSERVNRIVASNFGRIGKPADKDDDRVISEGVVLKEITSGGGRMAVELPLLDASGRTIGALSTSFRVDANSDADTLVKGAVTLRDQFARRINSVGALFKRVTASRQVRRLASCK